MPRCALTHCKYLSNKAGNIFAICFDTLNIHHALYDKFESKFNISLLGLYIAVVRVTTSLENSAVKK